MQRTPNFISTSIIPATISALSAKGAPEFLASRATALALRGNLACFRLNDLKVSLMAGSDHRSKLQMKSALTAMGAEVWETRRGLEANVRIDDRDVRIECEFSNTFSVQLRNSIAVPVAEGVAMPTQSTADVMLGAMSRSSDHAHQFGTGSTPDGDQRSVQSELVGAALEIAASNLQVSRQLDVASQSVAAD